LGDLPDCKSFTIPYSKADPDANDHACTLSLCDSNQYAEQRYGYSNYDKHNHPSPNATDCNKCTCISVKRDSFIHFHSCIIEYT